MNMLDGNMYGGAAKAGVPTNIVAVVKRPQFILRAVSWLFAIIVFSCISSGGYYKDQCVYSQESGPCSFGTGIGVMAFLICTVFLVIDVLFESLSNVQHRKFAVIGDLGLSGLWTFFWFIAFCLLTSKWRGTDPDWFDETDLGEASPEAAIAFSFFSVLSWGGLTALAFLRFRAGAGDAFAQGNPAAGGMPPNGAGAPMMGGMPPGGMAGMNAPMGGAAYGGAPPVGAYGQPGMAPNSYNPTSY